MKRVVLLVLCTLMLFVAGQGEAETMMSPDSFRGTMGKLAGTWYDEDGNTVLTIEGNMINGCEIVGGDRLANGPGSGSLDFIIREAAGTRTLRIGWLLFGGPGDYIRLNDGEALQRTLNPACSESVEGVRLGMRTRAVRERLGAGQELSRENACRAGDDTFAYGWHYPGKGLIVLHRDGIVTGLVLLPGSKLYFDRSGLGANDGRAAYARAYKMSEIPEERTYNNPLAFYEIAPGEFFSFGKNGSYVRFSAVAY
ncbi:hypothetical protein [Selenomonas sputigena]|uniref:hypothetical protein n=1 Tax=Selenomonas sputigena TaxID=69823 RepID=UPI00222E6ED5|nr:hypothetical protein [Selenomonas sputigena]UZD43107.1 hypothetical protein OL240_11395 [Selenomonas sputigena]